MVFKQVRCRKTEHGYSVWVNFRDGHHVKPLVSLIGQYFLKVEEAEDPERLKKILIDAERQISELERAKVLP